MESVLFPGQETVKPGDADRLFELYKIMAASSEALVGRRQAVNTFFLTANGALLTALGFFVTSGSQTRLSGVGVAILTVTGMTLAWAWQSLLRSFGQLNAGKFEVINRLEREFPAAIYAAEWRALGEGKDPRVYRSFTARETWVPRVLLAVYFASTAAAIAYALGWWSLPAQG